MNVAAELFECGNFGLLTTWQMFVNDLASSLNDLASVQAWNRIHSDKGKGGSAMLPPFEWDRGFVDERTRQ
jgi:hypothetical protein